MICLGCDVRWPHEHRCIGGGCTCPDCAEVERYMNLPKLCPECCRAAIEAGLAREGYLCDGCAFIHPTA